MPPFKSKAQRGKFFELQKQGKISKNTVDEWEKDTPADLPERVGPVTEKPVKTMGDVKNYRKKKYGV